MQDFNRDWTDEDVDARERARLVADSVRAIAHDTAFIYADMAIYSRLYGRALGDDGGAYESMLLSNDLRNSRVQRALVREVVDAAWSQITQARPRPMIVSDGGDWSMKSMSKKLNRLVLGVLQQPTVYPAIEMAVRDALICGTGFLLVDSEGKDLRVSRVLPNEVFVDELDAIDGVPSRIYRVTRCSRKKLTAIYGDDDAISNAITGGASYLDVPELGYLYQSSRNREDMVLVFEAWSLGLKDGEAGRHVICTTAGSLVDEEWNRPRLPIVAMRCSPPVQGFWGQGIAGTVASHHLEVNRILQRNQDAMRMFGVPQVYVEKGTALAKQQLDNSIGRIITYSGKPPTVVTSPVVLSESLDAVDRYTEAAYSEWGVNRMTAQGMKPAGIDSGLALQTWLDQGNTRLGPIVRAYEQAIVDLCRVTIDEARAMADRGDELELLAPKSSGAMSRIKWADANLDDDKFMVQVFPVNLLAKTPQARLEQIQLLQQMGLIADPRQAADLLDYPDIEAFLQKETASIDLTSRIIEKALDDGILISPTEVMDLNYAMRTVQNAIIRATVDGVPEERIELLRTWMRQALVIGEDQAAPPPESPDVMPEMAGEPVAMAGVEGEMALPPSDGMPEGMPDESALPLA